MYLSFELYSVPELNGANYRLGVVDIISQDSLSTLSQQSLWGLICKKAQCCSGWSWEGKEALIILAFPCALRIFAIWICRSSKVHLIHSNVVSEWPIISVLQQLNSSYLRREDIIWATHGSDYSLQANHGRRIGWPKFIFHKPGGFFSKPFLRYC